VAEIDLIWGKHLPRSVQSDTADTTVDDNQQYTCLRGCRHGYVTPGVCAGHVAATLRVKLTSSLATLLQSNPFIHYHG